MGHNIFLTYCMFFFQNFLNMVKRTSYKKEGRGPREWEKKVITVTLCNFLFNVDIKKTKVKVRDIETQEDGASNLIVKMSKKTTFHLKG